jgi:predicted metal-dependent peptidase
MTTAERITKAKVSLILNNSFFGQLIGYLIPIETDKVSTMGVDIYGKFYYNPAWVDKLSDNQITAVLMHEVMHLAYQHVSRFQERDLKIWNIAADLKVNNDLIGIGERNLPAGGILPQQHDCFSMNNGALVIDKISEKSTEETYNIFYHYFQKNSINITVDQNGKISVSGKGLTKEDKEKIESLIKDLQPDSMDGKSPNREEQKEQSRIWQERIASALQVSKTKGDIPGGLQRELNKLENPEIPWQRVLRERFNRISHARTWKKVNKRLLPNYFSGKTKVNSINAFIAIDSSGSVTKDELTKFISEIYGITKSFTKFKFYITSCDSAMHTVYELTERTKNKLTTIKLKGGGGTSFVPVFKYIEKVLKNKIDCLVYFTDGYGEYPEKKSPYHTYWILNSDYKEVPFGTMHTFDTSK